MAKKNINIGEFNDDPSAEVIRDSFAKSISNFNELYDRDSSINDYEVSKEYKIGNLVAKDGGIFRSETDLNEGNTPEKIIRGNKWNKSSLVTSQPTELIFDNIYNRGDVVYYNPPYGNDQTSNVGTLGFLLLINKDGTKVPTNEESNLIAEIDAINTSSPGSYIPGTHFSIVEIELTDELVNNNSSSSIIISGNTVTSYTGSSIFMINQYSGNWDNSIEYPISIMGPALQSINAEPDLPEMIRPDINILGKYTNVFYGGALYYSNIFLEGFVLDNNFDTPGEPITNPWKLLAEINNYDNGLEDYEIENFYRSFNNVGGPEPELVTSLGLFDNQYNQTEGKVQIVLDKQSITEEGDIPRLRIYIKKDTNTNSLSDYIELNGKSKSELIKKSSSNLVEVNKFIKINEVDSSFIDVSYGECDLITEIDSVTNESNVVGILLDPYYSEKLLNSFQDKLTSPDESDYLLVLQLNNKSVHSGFNIFDVKLNGLITSDKGELIRLEFPVNENTIKSELFKRGDILEFCLSSIPKESEVDISSLISSDPNNTLILGSDNKLLVSKIAKTKWSDIVGNQEDINLSGFTDGNGTDKFYENIVNEYRVNGGTVTPIDKILNIEFNVPDPVPSLFLGNYTSIANLEIAHPNPVEGNNANIDELGVDIKRATWDNTDNKWVLGNSVVATQETIAASSNKFNLVDEDTFTGLDSEDSNSLKKWKWSTIKSSIRTYLDSIYVSILGNQTIKGIKNFELLPTSSNLPSNNNQLANKSYVDSINTNWKIDYGLTGTINSINKEFFTSEKYVPGTIKVWVSGVLLFKGVDFTESGNNKIIISSPPLPGEYITADYLKVI